MISTVSVMTSRSLIPTLKAEIVYDLSSGFGGFALTKDEQTTVWEGGQWEIEMRAKGATSEAIEYSWQSCQPASRLKLT